MNSGRRLVRQDPNKINNLVVMLDAHCAFDALTDSDLHIYLGAYLGTPDEVLISRRLSEVSAQIKRVREAARREKGWIMDTYLLRRLY